MVARVRVRKTSPHAGQPVHGRRISNDGGRQRRRARRHGPRRMGGVASELARHRRHRVPRDLWLDPRLQRLFVRAAARLSDDRRDLCLREPRDRGVARLAAAARTRRHAHICGDGNDSGGGGVDSVLDETSADWRIGGWAGGKRGDDPPIRPSGDPPRTRGQYMTAQLPRDAVLLVVDVQKGMDVYAAQYNRNNPDLEKNIARLQAAWRKSGRPVIHVQHLSTEPKSPLRPGQPGVEIKDEVRPLPGEPVVQKRVSSAFIGTSLEADLRRSGLTTLVVVGMQTNMCVSTTARMAGNLGFTTYVVSDATATFDNIGPNGKRYASELVHDVALADLNGEFSTVVDTKTVLERAS